MPEPDLEKDDVTDSSTEDTDLDLEGEEEEEVEETTASDDSAPEKKERSVEQVKREFDRKFGKLAARLDAVLDRLDATPPATPSKSTKSSLDDYSMEELRTIRSNLTDDAQKVQLDDYIVERRIRDSVDKAIKSQTITQSFQQMKEEADTKARNRYPDLNDRTSDFYGEVRDRLRKLGTEYVNKNPRAILDVANDVAHDLGVTPKGTKKQIRGTVARRTNKAAPGDVSKPSMSQEQAERIAKNLQGALPPGKSFDLKKVVADHAEFLRNKDLFVK